MQKFSKKTWCRKYVKEREREKEKVKRQEKDIKVLMRNVNE